MSQTELVSIEINSMARTTRGYCKLRTSASSGFVDATHLLSVGEREVAFLFAEDVDGVLFSKRRLPEQLALIGRRVPQDVTRLAVVDFDQRVLFVLS